MKRVLFTSALAGAIALVALLGCQTANKFLGTWETEITVFNQTGKMVQVVNPDGTFTGDATFKMPMGSGDVNVKMDGTWSSADEKTLTLTQKNVTVTGLPKEIESMAKPEIEKNKDKPQTLTVTWNGNDEFTAAGAQGAGAMTFKRKK